MSLRARMLAGWAIIAGLLMVAGVGIYTVQRSYLVGQLDTRLARQLGNATDLATGSQATGGAGQPRGPRGLADTYVGVLTDRALRTVTTPATDPGLTPVLDLAEPPAGRVTVAATGGTADQIRLLTADLPGGEVLVVGRSMAEVGAALSGLRTALLAVGVVLLAVVGLVFGWMRRLGLDPILRVTEVARSHTAGDPSRRVEDFPIGTEAHDLGVAFNQLIDANDVAQSRLKQFVADASHELRTPLVTLKGYAALHSAGGMGDQAATADAMRRIKQEADRMSRLVEDLLLLAEMDRGPSLASAPVDLVPLLSGLVADLRVLAPDRSVTLDAPDAAVVSGDRDRITQVFAALTSNALRHTPPATPLDVLVTAAARTVRVEVTDGGPGIPGADLPHVFDRFYRADATRARASGGSGLGLAIASAIVTAHGGTIGVTSPPGRGATFWVELPGHA